ncbi:PREDICTED: uncharacterized protein LOC104725617 [Camelina sativa]|uniref:Uncharacterized protein LOC104725617 n=1 Tax=Camelina sativa TaxID=90675 RepID=A0ABM1QK20_CAMSA|nr:PREDICTED: uncharacterized protein LOC104725617 [Camelina sativa]
MSIKSVSLLVVILCIAASANAQLPQFPPFPFPFPNPFNPNPGMPGMPGMPDITKCWSSFMDWPGCFAEIRQAVMTHNFGSIGPACCNAFLDHEANCNPFFPPMLKQLCVKSAGPPTTAP